jgi:hypothetical protein
LLIVGEKGACVELVLCARYFGSAGLDSAKIEAKELLKLVQLIYLSEYRTSEPGNIIDKINYTNGLEGFSYFEFRVSSLELRARCKKSKFYLSVTRGWGKIRKSKEGGNG